jgi:hypothetical protein
MKAMYWGLGGFGLLALSRVIEAVGDTGTSPDVRLPFYFLALGILLGAAFCFIKGFRSAWYAITGKDRNHGADANGLQGNAVPARRLAEALAPDDDKPFDADAALARYMKQRSGQEHQTPFADQPAPPPIPRGFGRKGA